MIQRGAVSLGRINEIMNTVPSIRECENPQTSEKIFSVEKTFSVPALELKNLKFSYNEKETVLKAINLQIMRGEWLGIMGRTGSGKSTLIKTFTRTIDPPQGTVDIFGLDIHKWSLEELRELFAVSPQDNYLFSDSIANNITYGYLSENGSENDYKSSLDRAVKFASLEKDLEIFQNGKETLIGERGLTLSGGQKQRTAIARAIIMNAEFLILDDSLSAVDNETEQKIMEILRNERKNRTTIIISHRVSTLKYADNVLVLDKGKAIEYGPPAQLVSSGGFYSRMAAFQRLELHPEKENG
jgi:ATP-binding cassette subfamily B protein